MASTQPWPTEIRHIRAERRIEVDFDDGRTFSLPAEFLRVESPSAEVQGHHPDEKKILPGKQNVQITGITHVGRYAVQITFDDGHDTGFYAWTRLYTMGQHYDTIWATYLSNLKKQGLSREG